MRLFLLLAATSLSFAADVPTKADAAKPEAKAEAPAGKRASVAQRAPLLPAEVEGVAKEDLAKVKAALLKAFQDESVKAARERLAEVRARLEFATGAEKKDIAADARRATDEIRSATIAAIRKGDESIKLETLEKVMDAIEDKRAKALDGAKKGKKAAAPADKAVAPAAEAAKK